VGETDRAGGTARHPPDHGTARARQVHVVAKRLAQLSKERCGAARKLAIISATGFRAASSHSQPAWHDRQETARFPGGLLLP